MRAHGDVLRVRTPVRKPEDLVANGPAVFDCGVFGQLGDCAAEFDAEGGGRVGRDGVAAFALEEVHAV